MLSENLSRVLIIDDLFGRSHPDRPNAERASLCGQYLLDDITGDQTAFGTRFGTRLRVKRPLAQAFFCPGQQPKCSVIRYPLQKPPNTAKTRSGI